MINKTYAYNEAEIYRFCDLVGETTLLSAFYNFDALDSYFYRAVQLRAVLKFLQEILKKVRAKASQIHSYGDYLSHRDRARRHYFSLKVLLPWLKRGYVLPNGHHHLPFEDIENLLVPMSKQLNGIVFPFQAPKAEILGQLADKALELWWVCHAVICRHKPAIKAGKKPPQRNLVS